MPWCCEPWPGNTAATISLFYQALRYLQGMPPGIETFENPAPQRDYLIVHTFPEFTSMCPRTGQPDFATIELEYVPDALCIELKALKLYYNSFRSEGIFYEAVTNRILEELSAACNPRWMRVTGRFNVRGGIVSVIRAETGLRPSLAE